MNRDPHVELAELAALVAASVQDARGRGALQVPTDSVLPARGSAPESAAPEQRPVAEDLDPLPRVHRSIGDCQRCSLAHSRTRLVYGQGPRRADLAVIGGVPGAEEDAQGRCWAGEAGAMLDRMLSNVLGLRREQVFLSHVVMCRAPEDQKPRAAEIASCQPLIRAQLRAVGARIVLLMGERALRAVLGKRGIGEQRGRWQQAGGLPMLSTYSPRFLLRSPSYKRQVFADLKELRRRYDQMGGLR